jgi:CRP/FNR family cyclic AMP-dependent transcriptional regulator
MSDYQTQLYERYGKKIPANTVLFCDGDVGEHMYVIQTGKVKISKKIRGVEKTLATLGKGEFFGEMAILNDKPRSASAETLEECEMLVVERKTFESLIRGNPEVAVRFIKRLADRLREANEQMESMMIRDNTSRLVSLLAKGIREHKQATAYSIKIADLAGLAGIEATVAKSILDKLTHFRIAEMTEDSVSIRSQEQVDRLLRYLEMREIFGETS